MFIFVSVCFMYIIIIIIILNVGLWRNLWPIKDQETEVNFSENKIWFWHAVTSRKESNIMLFHFIIRSSSVNNNRASFT